jgi:hypothetical protein
VLEMVIMAATEAECEATAVVAKAAATQVMAATAARGAEHAVLAVLAAVSKLRWVR